jgi:heptaprenyl diphosphate synthase
MTVMINWVEGYICGTRPKQMVVGNRLDSNGNLVTQTLFDTRDKQAHVCPFVRDSIDRDLFWIEESFLDASDPNDIEQLLRKQIQDFKDQVPPHDPLATGNPAGLPELWKTFLTFFPRIIHKSKQGAFPFMDTLHQNLKPDFVRNGLMLGQFYAGCPEPAIYNPMWKGPLLSPYPTFAIRYMAVHDKLFISQNTPEWTIYKSFFP